MYMRQDIKTKAIRRLKIVEGQIRGLQKMVEDVSDMLVKELPAIVDSVNSEIGTNEGDQYSTQATEALSGLQAALTTARAGLQSALGIVTGQGGGMMGGMGDMGGEEGPEMGGELPMPGEEAELGAMDAEELGEPESEEEPEIPPPSYESIKKELEDLRKDINEIKNLIKFFKMIGYFTQFIFRCGKNTK